MKLGEIKAQAMMLMGIGGGVPISYGDIDGYKQDPSYAPYIHAMNGAVNRCLSRLYVVGAIQEEHSPVDVGTDEGYEMSVPERLAQLIPLYVVGDVFALEEPSVAQNKRNEFESSLEDYMNKCAFQKQNAVEIVYGV